eukprot:TRINITY_DN6416_c0_g1_i1.p1 TRINITY_DN6416_c0_g1~~TRINITY_DN6416_c0_g1_i1.p1  ORF type:complete len:134 (-),score=26.94 TRINITY_DN6416_c0_g1_i1:62-463(-)
MSQLTPRQKSSPNQKIHTPDEADTPSTEEDNNIEINPETLQYTETVFLPHLTNKLQELHQYLSVHSEEVTHRETEVELLNSKLAKVIDDLRCSEEDVEDQRIFIEEQEKTIETLTNEYTVLKERYPLSIKKKF